MQVLLVFVHVIYPLERVSSRFNNTLATTVHAASSAASMPFGNAPNGWAIRYGDPEWKSFLDAFVNYVTVNKIAVGLYDTYLKKTNPFAK